MKKIIGVLLSGIFFSGYPAIAAEQAEKSGRNNPYKVYEEKWTEDTPLPPVGPGEKLSYLWNATDVDGRPAGISAIFEMAESVGFDVVAFSTRGMSSIVKGTNKGVPDPAGLDSFVAEAKKRNMRVMVIFNFNLGRLPADRKESNLLDQEYNEQLFGLVDAIAEINEKHGGGNIIIYWDEIWCNEIQYTRKDEIALFRDFCADEYGEAYRGVEMPPKTNPADKWWRRYVVFKNCIYENFCRRLLDHTRKKGLPVINRPYPSYISSSGWKWGMDSYRLSKLADYNQTWHWRIFEGDYYENSVMGGYKDPNALSMSLYLKGYPLQYFTYGYLRDNPWAGVKLPEMMKQAKIWRGAERKAEVCVLNYSVALTGLFAGKSPAAYNDNDGLITERLSRYFETDRTDVRNSRFYKNYQTLIIPKYSAYSIPGYAYNGMLEYVKNGGTVIAVDAEIGIGKRDLTDPENKTAELAGVKPAPGGNRSGVVEFQQGFNRQAMPISNTALKFLNINDKSQTRVLASYQGNPVITEHCSGKGRVVYLGFNIAELIKRDGKWLEVLKDIVMRYGSPAVLSDGKVNIESVIKKADRVLISLYPAADAPGTPDASKAEPTDQIGDLLLADGQTDGVNGTVSIDTARLGLSGDSFRVFGVTNCGTVKNKDAGEIWTPEELKKGISFTIDGRAGYEHLIIEPPGVTHTEESIIQKIADVDQNIRERITDGKKNPRGLNEKPFTVKTASAEASYATGETWAVKSDYRIGFHIENALGFARKAEPVILKWKDLAGGAVQPARKDSVRLYKAEGGKQEEILCQMNGEGELISDTDEFVFIDDFEAGRKNEYILYFGHNPFAPRSGSGIVIDKTADGKGVGISNGLVRAEIKPNTEMTLSDEKSGKAVLQLHGCGGRYEGRSYNVSAGNFNWTARGPVHCRVEIKTGRQTVFTTVYEFFNRSPYVKISYSSSFDQILMDEASYRPYGTLPGEGASANALIASGWAKVGSNQTHGLVPMRNDVSTVIKQQNTVPFGWLLAYSDIPVNPRLLLSKGRGGGMFILEFAEHHSDFIPQWKPRVSWIYVHDISSEDEIDHCAKILENPLPVVCSAVKKEQGHKESEKNE